MISVLGGSKFLLATFKLSSLNLYQIYPLQESKFLVSPQHVCMPFFHKKTKKKTYNRLLDALETFAPDCTPGKVLLDFKIAAINAF